MSSIFPQTSSLLCRRWRIASNRRRTVEDEQDTTDFKSVFPRFAPRRKSSPSTWHLIESRSASHEIGPNFGTNRHQNRHSTITPVGMKLEEKISRGRLSLYALEREFLSLGPDKSFEQNRCRFTPTPVLSRFQINKGKSACRYQSLSGRRLGPATFPAECRITRSPPEGLFPREPQAR